MQHAGYHKLDASGTEIVLENYGHMYEVSTITKRFIEFASTARGPVLDVGCAYGINTIPCLAEGAEVIACDIEQAHLDELALRTPAQLSHLLTPICRRFPDEVDYPNGALGGILLSHVMGFLSPEEIQRCMEKMHRWLIPGGKIFVMGYTPYFKDNEAKIAIFERRLAKRTPWPGYITRIIERPNLPFKFHSLHPNLLKSLFPADTFNIDFLDYIGHLETPIPEWLRLDGRENVGLIATRR